MLQSMLLDFIMVGCSFFLFLLIKLILLYLGQLGRMAGSLERLATWRFGYRLATIANPVPEPYREGSRSLVIFFQGR